MVKPHKKFHPERDVYAPLVGLNYRVGIQLQAELAENTPLAIRLEREPGNQHDPNAVKVILSEIRPDMHIGYISRDVAAKLAPRIDSGQIQIEAAAVTEIDEESGSGTVIVSYRKNISS